MISIRLNNVDFTYDSLTMPLFEGLTITYVSGWTGIIGENGKGKTTLLKLITGDLAPTNGSIHRPDTVAFCDQRTDVIPEGFGEFLSSPDNGTRRIIAFLEIADDWLYRWDSLSHGERKEGFSLQSSVSGRRYLFHIDSILVPLGGDRRLDVSGLSLGNTQKVALIGDNGSGKSSFLRRLQQDTLVNSALAVAWIPQELDANDGFTAKERVMSLGTEDKAREFSTVFRLGSDPRKLFASELPSPGEIRKLLLGLCVMDEIELLILDEPTKPPGHRIDALSG